MERAAEGGFFAGHGLLVGAAGAPAAPALGGPAPAADALPVDVRSMHVGPGGGPALDPSGAAHDPLSASGGEATTGSSATWTSSTFATTLGASVDGGGGFSESSYQRGRPASPHLSSINTNSLAQRTSMHRAGSTPGSARQGHTTTVVTSKPMPDSTILTAVRRQMEALEDKLSGQINRVQQQSDRLRDAALHRVDSKMGTMEAIQPKLDRRVAELSGNYKGLSDEMQSQIRRIDLMDTRLWEWRHQMEEEIRQKLSDIEQGYQQLKSSIRIQNATYEDTTKRANQRVLRVESLIEERLSQTEEHREGIMQLHARLSEIEDLREAALYSPNKGEAVQVVEQSDAQDRAVLLAIETRLADNCHKVESMMTESNDLHTRVEAQEERLKTLRTLLEQKEEQYRQLNDTFKRADWEGRCKQFEKHFFEIDQHRVEFAQRVELLQKKVESSAQAYDEVNDQCHKLQERVVGLTEVATSVEQTDITVNTGSVGNDTLSLEVNDCLHRTVSRITELEGQIERICGELHCVRTDAALAPRVAKLVDQLKDVAPKVIEQEGVVRELLEKVGRIEVEEKMHKAMASDPVGQQQAAVAAYAAAQAATQAAAAAQEQASHAAAQPGSGALAPLQARVGRLEVEVQRLCAVMEGTELTLTQVVETVEVASDDEGDPGAAPPKRMMRRASATE